MNELVTIIGVVACIVALVILIRAIADREDADEPD